MRRTINYEVSYRDAKYRFVRRGGWHLKIKKMCSEMVKIDQKVQNVLLGVDIATLVG